MRPGSKPRPFNTTDPIALKKAIRGWKEIKPTQFATLHGLSVSRVRELCNEGRIEGAWRDILGHFMIPRHAKILKIGDTKCKRLHLAEDKRFCCRPSDHRRIIMVYAETSI
jgi:hypothetical protein